MRRPSTQPNHARNTAPTHLCVELCLVEIGPLRDNLQGLLGSEAKGWVDAQQPFNEPLEVRRHVREGALRVWGKARGSLSEMP